MKARRFGLIAGLLLTATAMFADELYKENVVASFYADKFNGRRTASGEIFDINGFTAAHKTLPFGTILKVTNLDNGKAVKVRINDRGPFVQGREIDVSKAAARELDMINSGTAHVSLVILEDDVEGAIAAAEPENPYGDYADTTYAEPAVAEADPYTEPEPETPPPAPVKPASKPAASSKPVAASNTSASASKADDDVAVETKVDRWDIQLGAYTSKGNAKLMAHKLLQAGFKNVAYQKVGNVTRVVLRDIPSDELDEVASELDKAGFTQYIVRERKNVVTKE